MSVTPVGAVSLQSQDPARQQSGLRQDLLSLQKALLSGNLSTAQGALDKFHQDLQSIRPQHNGITASVDLDPQSTIRKDLQVLQSALDSGDLTMAQEAFARIQQDARLIAAAQANPRGGQASPAATFKSASSDHSGAEGAGISVGVQPEKSKGNAIDIIA